MKELDESSCQRMHDALVGCGTNDDNGGYVEIADVYFIKTLNPDGSKVASWVVTNKNTKAVILETYSCETACKVNQKVYNVTPILQHLQSLS
jgi:hypothetical protein